MNSFFERYHEALFNCNKPYQYVGGEFLSRNKSFDDAKVRFAFVFPDKYEIGISNLGVRVLYEQVNAQPDFMADRCYAPEPDFKPEPLYALESKRPLKDFDALGFSLQYELAYPTVLKMLDMAGIPYRNDELETAKVQLLKYAKFLKRQKGCHAKNGLSRWWRGKIQDAGQNLSAEKLKKELTNWSMIQHLNLIRYLFLLPFTTEQ